LPLDIWFYTAVEKDKKVGKKSEEKNNEQIINNIVSSFSLYAAL
jgi:hypothetical protein